MQVVGDPSYFPDKVQKSYRVVRAMCVMSHPIPSTNESHSVQIILPQKQVGPTNTAGTAAGAYVLTNIASARVVAASSIG